MQLELKFKQQINNFLLKRKPTSKMSFSLSSSNTSSTSMKSLKDETFRLPSQLTHASSGQILVIIISQSRFSIPSLGCRKLDDSCKVED
jgi:hypothetical protein